MTQKSKPQGSASPDLDQALRQWHKKLHQVNIGAIIVFIIIASIVAWALSGVFIVGAQEKAVVLRFGKYISTKEAGLHWAPPFIDSREVINTEQMQTYPYRAQILTKDDNIVLVNINVQYRIDSAKNYLFNVADPEQTLQQATASALRQTVGSMSLNDLFITQVQTLDQNIKQALITILAPYHMGVMISEVNMLPVRLPAQVETIAQAPANNDEVKQAQAYAQSVVAQAQAKTAPFLAALAQYEKAPKVTRDQLYIDAMQNVLTNASTILFASNDVHPQFYLPLDLFSSPNAVVPWRINNAKINASNNTFVYPSRPQTRPTSRPTRPENNNEKI